MTWLREHWGDLSSMLGLVVSLVGFAVTLVGVYRSQSASKRAESAAEAVKSRFVGLDVAALFSELQSSLAEIKRLQRNAAWATVVDRYAASRKIVLHLNSVLQMHEQTDPTPLSGVNQHLIDLEQRVEKCLATNQSPPSVAGANRVISGLESEVSELQAAVRQCMEIGKND